MKAVHHKPCQGGFILMPVVLAIVLMATIAFLLNNQSAIDVDITAAETEARQAGYVAAAGMRHAIWSAQNNACGGDMSIINEPFGQDSYSTTVDTGGTITTSNSFVADRDTWIRENKPNDSYAADNELKVKNKPSDLRYALYHFDLSSIASNKKVLTANIWLYVDREDNEGRITLHPLTADWTEASATWNSIGSSFESPVYGAIMSQPTSGVWVSVNITALAQSWVSDSTTNYGFLLKATSSDVESKYTSKESVASQRPRLEITTADGEVSPVQVTATGTLAPDVQGVSNTRVLTRNNVTLYQPNSNTALQPGAAGTDSYVYQDRPDWNHGVNNEIWVENRFVDAMANGLLKFNLADVPYGARVTSAVLELYQTNSSLSGGPVNVYRLSSDWVEGTKNGTFGSSNWTQRDDVNLWASPGGDYGTVSFATTTVAAGTGWSAWEITDLANGWMSGEFNNNGLALVAGTFGSAAHFASSDSADATRRPKLTISYACECGKTCLVPQGSANVLMVVADDSVLTASETFKKTLFESWGYTVNLDNDDSSAADFLTQAASNDVIYISESVDEDKLGSKLTELTIGVVSEQGKLNDELGIATGNTWSVGSSINVSDTSHYITRVFTSGDLAIYSAGMEQLTMSGATAPGLQQLADSGGAGSLVLLETGAAEIPFGGSYSGDGTASGRRVMLPLGRDGSFNWKYLNSSGRLLVQRAIQWGAGG